MTASTTRIAERLVLTRATSPTLLTTTATTRSGTTTSTAPAANSVTFTVTRTGPTSLTDVTVRYTVSGSALNGKDYSALSVELDRPAPAGGATVQFQTSRPDLLDLSSITVPPNATTGSATVRTGVDNTQASVSNTAVLGTSQATLSVTVNPQPIDRVQVPGTVQAGTQAQGFVRLSLPAPPGGMHIPLSSSNPAEATVPPTIVIPAGQTQVSFNVTTRPVPTNTEVTVTAGVGVATATFRVRTR